MTGHVLSEQMVFGLVPLVLRCNVFCFCTQKCLRPLSALPFDTFDSHL